ncbi:MAG: hypothetical protein ACOC2F_08340 [Bacteroidota bacterium]
MDEITGKPRSNESLKRILPDELHRVALHEAGHALLRMLNESSGEKLAYISIVPRNNGRLGFVASLPSSSVSHTKKTYLEILEVLLGGRAAEEVILGSENVSSGAGGDENSDLGKATRLAESMVTRYGFGKNAGLVYADLPNPDQEKEAGELINDCYRAALSKLYENKERLQKIIDILIKRQEISGNDLRELLK